VVKNDKLNFSAKIKKNYSALFITTSALFLILTLAYWVYEPGLSGGFVFDDEVNLVPIGQFGGVKDFATLVAFLTSEGVLPGRPISLLSFLLDGNDWPLDTKTLKLTNLKIHLLVGMLVFWLSWLCSSLQFASLALSRSQTIWFALWVTLLWLLNPYQVSTVSYIIQRMTELSALFVLAGLICFVKGRMLLVKHQWMGLGLASLGLVVFGLMTILAKENGILICAFALLFDRILFSNEELSGHKKLYWSWWKRIFLWAPLVLLLIYLLYRYRFFTTGYEIRDFTVIERLLTEPRILFLYIKGILFSSLSDSGLYSFKGVTSVSLFKPASTILSIIAIIVIIVGAVKVSRKIPLLALGVLFFFTGHIIESTAIPLELYFEHRNYLPQFGLWLGFCSLAVFLVQKTKRLRKLGLVFAVSIVLMYSGITYARSHLWGDTFLMSKIWHENNPRSVRTALFYSSQLVANGYVSEATSVLSDAAKYNPQSVAIRLSTAIIGCKLTEKGFNGDEYIALAKNAPLETAAQEAMVMFYEMLEKEKKCEGLSAEALGAITLSYISNPYYANNGKVVSYLFVFLSDLEYINKNLDGVMMYRDQACERLCNPRIRYDQAVFLISAGLYADALNYLEKADALRTPHEDIKDPFIELQIQSLMSSVRKINNK
jgi:hypothetical protein